jgi:WD40 repeat protein
MWITTTVGTDRTWLPPEMTGEQTSERADGRLVKIWDYHSKSCIQTLESHTANVSFAIFHPSLPIILSGSEDGTVKIWHSSTYRLENTLSYGLERAWCVAYRKSGNEVAIGYDEGAVVVKVSMQWFKLTSSLEEMSHQSLWIRLGRLYMPGTLRS